MTAPGCAPETDTHRHPIDKVDPSAQLRKPVKLGFHFNFGKENVHMVFFKQGERGKSRAQPDFSSSKKIPIQLLESFGLAPTKTSEFRGKAEGLAGHHPT